MKSASDKKRKYSVNRRSSDIWKGSQWNIYVKTEWFEKVVNSTLDRMGRPGYIWRNQIFDNIHQNETLKKDYSDRVVRHMISVCMTDPEITGYMRDGGRSTRNPRFRRADLQ